MLTSGSRNERYALFVLALLCFVYVLNFLDRQLLSILAKPIQDELGISDGQLGRLGGLYFALFYCILGVPVAWLADRGNRVRVLSIACAVWSAATAFVLDHFRLLPGHSPRDGAGTVQPRPSHRPGIGRGLRREDCGGL
jgi:predicted MFS family arabinose efflux permease